LNDLRFHYTMRIFKLTILSLLILTIQTGCNKHEEHPPTTAQIESAGLQALYAHQTAAIDQLKSWAQQDMPIAQRELALAYRNWPTHESDARFWLQKAANGGDCEAQFQLAEALYKGELELKADHTNAGKWYETAAKAGNAKASFMLARMAKYGDGIPQDQHLSIMWLMESSRNGNPQAMFLLSNAYAAGDGVDRNEMKAREWLEKSAAGDYPVAIQALAMSLETGDMNNAGNATRARHLLKEASDERLMHWKNYQ